MQLKYIVSKLGLEILNPELKDWEEREIKWGYTSDLLSIVMAEAKPGDLWITKQIHLNIVAVALLNDLAGIVVCGKKPEENTIAKAVEENIPLFFSKQSAFEISGKLYQIIYDQGNELKDG
jgi:hypothetical protein